MSSYCSCFKFMNMLAKTELKSSSDSLEEKDIDTVKTEFRGTGQGSFNITGSLRSATVEMDVHIRSCTDNQKFTFLSKCHATTQKDAGQIIIHIGCKQKQVP